MNPGNEQKRFRSLVWEKVFKALIADPSNDYVMLDASLVKAHQQAATGKKGATKTGRWGAAEED